MVYDKTIPQTGVCRIILALCIALICVLLDSEGPSIVFISRQLRHIPSWRRHEACHMLQVFEQFIAENAKFSAQQNLRRKAQMVAMMKLSNFDAILRLHLRPSIRKVNLQVRWVCRSQGREPNADPRYPF